MSVQLSTAFPYALPAGAGKPMAWFEATVTLKASSPEMGVTEVLINRGEEPPFHVHKNEDEWFYMLEGEMMFHVGGETITGLRAPSCHFRAAFPTLLL